jgi:2-polyprenyl-3-methyl-5-hydroxy-6-metoxy-1,4-benzoquinol methylase
VDCCQCQGIEGLFNAREAARSLRGYRRKGPSRSTRILLDALHAAGVEGATLLDIGGGIGAIQLDLLAAGVTSATDVDASSAYLAAAREEGARRGFSDRVRYQHGNFVALAPTIAPADIVTLDRVICCYHDLRGLVQASAAKSLRLYGLVYPRDAWLARMAVASVRLVMRLQRNPFRMFAHRDRDVEALLHAAGLERRFHRNAGFWQVAVYARTA